MSDIFDATVLQSLRDLEAQTGEELVSEMINEFIEEVPKVVESMQTYCNESKYAELSRVAHSLKSSAANVGALKISSLSQTIESSVNAAPGEKPENIESVLKEMSDIIAPTIECLKAT